MNALGLVSPFVVIGISAWLLRVFTRGLKSWEKRLTTYAFVFQLAAIFAIIGVTKYYYGGGDMLNYHEHGNRIASLWESDFSAISPMVWELLLQIGGDQLVPYGERSPTGSMHAVVAILGLVTGGSLFGECAIVGFAGFFSRLVVYKQMREELAPRYWRPILIATMLMPSVVFWSSGLLKESVALAAIGPLVWGARQLAYSRQRLKALVALALGLLGCGLFKAYILPPFVLAAAATYYVIRAQKRGVTVIAKPARLMLAVLVAIGLLLMIGTVLPRYDFRTIQSQVAKEQHQGTYVQGGSDFSLQGTTPSSTASFLVAAPWAVITALFRPAIIEVRNPLSLINSLETLILLLMLLKGLRGGPWQAVRKIRTSSLLTFCSVFTLVLAMGVGFSTTNMGTLSRYRMPLVPFFVVVLVVLRDESSKKRRGVQLRDH